MAININGIRRRTWAEINLDNAEYNFNQIKNALKPKVKLCCVIKANGYGHGAVELGQLYQDLGADMFAVSNIEEALQLRAANISIPILILGFTPPECAKLLAQNNITQCIFSYEYADKLNTEAKFAGVTINVHIKIDTGMRRIGFICRETEESIDEIVKSCELSNLESEGIFTHFAVADESINGKEFTEYQFDNFTYVIDKLEKRGVRFKIKHCVNSAGIFDYNNFDMDMARAGIVLYGLQPSSKVAHLSDLRPVMSLYSVISHIKKLKANETVSYGKTYRTEKNITVATVPIGYADGFYRSNGNEKYALLVNNKQAPIIGRVCMDQLMIDISEIDCKIGDIVTVFGEKKGNTATDIARLNNTINYEVVCNIDYRVPRIYIKNGKIVKITDRLIAE